MVTHDQLFEKLDRARLTANHYKIISAAVLGDMLDFFDYYIIGFVLTYIVVPWRLSFAQSAIVLMATGLGSMAGAFGFGYLADRIGRRPVMIVTVLTFSLPSGLLYFTPEGNWVFLTVFRFVIGLGVGGLYSVDLPLVQEFVPSSYRGFVSGMVTAFIPIGALLGSASAAFLGPIIGWRGLFLIGLAPALMTLLIRAWVPESPRWLVSRKRYKEAVAAINWVTGASIDYRDVSATRSDQVGEIAEKIHFLELFKYPRSLLVSWLSNFLNAVNDYGFLLWATTLLSMVLNVSPAEAARMFIIVALGSFAGKIFWAYMSEKVGRRIGGMLVGLGSSIAFLIVAAYYDSYWNQIPVLWLAFIGVYFMADGGFSIIGPYASEVWPMHLRASGMGSAYGIGGLGRLLGPAVLAWIAGSSNLVTPKATIEAVTPAFSFFAVVGILLAAVFYFGFETRGKSIEELDRVLGGGRDSRGAGRSD